MGRASTDKPKRTMARDCSCTEVHRRRKSCLYYLITTLGSDITEPDDNEWMDLFKKKKFTAIESKNSQAPVNF